MSSLLLIFVGFLRVSCFLVFVFNSFLGDRRKENRKLDVWDQGRIRGGKSLSNIFFV
jgi:NADH:ubiquinone oxidoreductase subunit 3 (subunit A)